MALIDSLIRKKRLLLSQRRAEWHEATRRRDNAARTLSIAKHAHLEAHHYLWQQLSQDSELCVQRLAAAKAVESRCDERLRECLQIYQTCVRDCEALERAVTQLHREIEKLEEIRVARLGALADARQILEWQRLDEWVTVRHGVAGKEGIHE